MPTKSHRIALAVIACLATHAAAPVPQIHASCNLIPVAGTTFPSSQAGLRSGSVSGPVAAPGSTVTVTVDPACDTLPPGFTIFEGTETVVITFLPPAGPTTTVAGLNVQVIDAHNLSFDVPNTAGVSGSTFGLAGPARIEVKSGATTIATIGPLHQPSAGCDLAAESIFGHFTIVPPPNDVATQSTAPVRMLATLDGNDNLLIPLDHTGGNVLPEGPSQPVARLLTGGSTFPAFDGPPSPLFSEALSIALTVTVPMATSEELLRSFTIDGRPLPPLLRLDDDGFVFGTVDAPQSVLRVARLDGPGNPIFDFTTRFDDSSGSDIGPIVINPAFTLAQCDPVPLSGLHSSTGVVAFARDETKELQNLNDDGVTGDTDMLDRVVQIINVAAGGQGCGFETQMAVTEIDAPGNEGPVLEAEGSLVAFLESEAAQGPFDLTADGDQFDHVLRVFTATGSDLTVGTNFGADPAPRVNDQSLVIADPLVFFRTQDGSLSFVETDATGGAGPVGLSASPDGTSVYVTNSTVETIDVFSRDPATGALTFESQTPVFVRGAIRISPDGLHGYVATAIPGPTGAFSFTRDTVSGALTPLQAIVGPEPSEAVALSTDGLDVYVVGPGGVLAARRDPATGLLSFNGSVTGLPGARAGVLSPDDRHLYVAQSTTDEVAVLSRDPVTGVIALIEQVSPGGLSSPWDVAVSPDGKHVYASSLSLDTAVVFSRDSASGRLTFVQVVVGGGGAGLAVSPDGAHVYVARGGVVDPELAVFSRNATTGALTFVETREDGVGGVDGLDLASAVLATADGAHVYATGFNENKIALFQAGSGLLQVLDTGTGPPATLRSVAETGAGDVAVIGQQAVVLTPEASEGPSGTFLNNDNDKNDQVPQVYDGVGDVRTSLEVAATRVAVSADLIAMTLDEANENQPLAGDVPTDFNGDNDTVDEVLGVQPLPLGVPDVQNVGVAADTIAVTGSTVILITPEASEGPGGIDCTATSPTGGCDLNDDEDASDRVLRIYDATGGVFTETARFPAEEFVLGGSLLAFRTREDAQSLPGLECGPTSPPSPPDGCDRNGDRDTADAVMMIYDLATDPPTLIPTGQAAIPCDLSIPGCEGRGPYRIKGDTVSFLTREEDQNTPPADLDGDGSTSSVVLQVFNVRSQKLQLFPLCDTIVDPIDVLPGDFVDRSLLNIRGLESAFGIDFNDDGDTDDCVLLVSGDSDDDGTFDDFDICTENPNPDQVDSDLDGLGDTCDPTAFCGDFVPPTPAVAPGDSLDCQKGISKAAFTYLTKRTAAVRTCLDKIAKGKLAGDPTTLCRGNFAGSVEVPPQDPTTAKKLAKAAEKFTKNSGKKCTADGQVAHTCAATVSGLSDCVLPAYGTGANDAATLAYGAVGAIADPVVLACQRAVGKESRNYVRKVTKAMHKCLDKLNAGKLMGDGQTLCLGSLTPTPGGVVLPTNETTLKKLQKAEEKLRANLAKKCPGTELESLDVCSGLATTNGAAADCIACTHWRRAVEGVRNAYGE